jgi:23S rRNA pseudouridine1911/1915/1917 synthase
LQKIVKIAESDARLDVVVSQMAECSRSQAAKWIEAGQCMVKGTARTKTGFKVQAGDEVEISIPDPVEMTVEKEEIPLDILYEDEDVAVVVKPYGMVVHPAPGNESGTLVNALLYAMEDLSGIGGVKRPGIVHRLDKDTSGVIMIAKNDLAHESLSAQLKERTMDKRYLALVEGNLKEDEGSIDQPIARSKKDRKKMAIDPEGRESQTEWKVLERLKNSTLLEVHILTGRTHQIRVHMQHIHHPVVGDPIYGAKNGVKASRLMLHAWKLDFDHPRTGGRLHFEAEPPENFRKILDRVRRETK